MESIVDGIKHILLVSPDFNPDDTKVRYVHFKSSGFFDLPLTPAKSFMAPLGLATVSALSPEGFNVDIWDEGIRGLITPETKFGKNYDLVGITGYVSHTSRMRELGRLFRERGILTVCGGPDVSGSPEHYRDYFDVLFIGEAEYKWPEFLADWANGNYRSEYRQVDKPPMADSPGPRWDKLAPYMKDYSVAAVQTTRGCPFDCNFCDVVYIFGREPRHKSVEQVVEEVRALKEYGANVVFLCDDNFIGTPKYTRELLKALIALNKEFDRPMAFNTQITLNITDPQNEDILQALANANFTNLFIGVESPSEEALRSANKHHNLHDDIAKSIEKIHSYGMIVQPGMIVGFDDDDTTIFDRHVRFIQQTGMWNPMENTLKAPLGTKFWVQMQQEGRIVRPRNMEHFEEQIGSDLLTNILPAKMSRETLSVGYRDMVIKIRDWQNFEDRGKTMLRQISRRPSHLRENYPSWDEIRKQIPIFARNLFPEDIDENPARVATLFRVLRKSPPSVVDKLLGPIVRHYLGSTNLEQAKAKEQVSAFIPFLMSIDEEVALSILRLIFFTLKRAPYMLEQVLSQIGRQYMLAAQLPGLVSAVDEQIQWEHEYGLDIEPKVFFIPDEFRKIYPGIFPGLYERGRSALQNKSETLNVLVGATYDFLTRWGENFREYDNQMRIYFHEICDQAIAAENRNSQVKLHIGDADTEDPQFIGLAAGQVGVRIKRWANDVLHSVEQRMRAFNPQDTPNSV